MISLIYSEMIKLNKYKKIFLVPLLSLVFLLTINKVNWNVYFSESEYILFISVFMMVFMLVSFVFQGEFSNNTIKLLYNYPISAKSIFMAKLLVIYIIIALVYIFNFILFTLVGLFLVNKPLTNELFFLYLMTNLSSMIFQFSIIPIIITLTNVFKRVSTTGIIVFISNFIMYEVGKSKLWPFMLPYMPFLKITESVNSFATIGLAIGTFVVGLMFGVLQLSNVQEYQ